MFLCPYKYQNLGNTYTHSRIPIFLKTDSTQLFLPIVKSKKQAVPSPHGAAIFFTSKWSRRRKAPRFLHPQRPLRHTRHKPRDSSALL